MRAIIIKKFGGVDSLVIENLPDPKPASGQVLIQVKAFGINHAETHMRQGKWAEAALVSGMCLAGWLGGLDPVNDFNPLLHAKRRLLHVL